MKSNSLTKKILKGILVSGEILVDAATPYYALSFPRALARALRMKSFLSQSRKNSPFDNAFYYLKRKGYLEVGKRNNQIYVSLAEAGRRNAGKYLIDDLKIKKPKRWDGKWRIVIFDIPNMTRIKRDALRGKLKELKFYRLQQSVWVYPYECGKEIDLLREFFGLASQELILIRGEIKNDRFLRKFFKTLT